MNHQKSFFMLMLCVMGLQKAAPQDCIDFAPHQVIERIDRYVDCIVTAPYNKQLADVLMTFKYERVRNGFQKVIQEQSFASLQTTWQAIKANVGITLDYCETAEFSVVLIMAYSSAIKQLTEAPSTSVNRVNWLSVIALYAQLNMLPLAKLFDVLEECWHRYQDIMNSFPKDENQSWLDWAIDYWWVPVTLVIFTALSFARWYRAHLKLPI